MKRNKKDLNELTKALKDYEKGLIVASKKMSVLLSRDDLSENKRLAYSEVLKRLDEYKFIIDYVLEDEERILNFDIKTLDKISLLLMETKDIK